MSKILIFWLIFLGCSGIAFTQNLKISGTRNSQTEDSSKTKQSESSFQKTSNNFYRTDSIFSFCSRKGYIPSLLHNFGEQATAPFHLTKKQYIITGLAIGIDAVLIHFDNEVDEWARIQKQKHNWVNRSSPVITQFGASYGLYAVVATGLLSASFKNEKGVQTSLLATQAIITSGVWVRIIKLITGRERPEATYIYSNTKGGIWYGPFAQFDHDLAVNKPGSSFDSFPSGHTATAFSIAAVFATQYKDSRIIPVLSYSLASLVGISRLTEHKHWSSDVFAGAFIGYLCGKQVVSHYNKTHQNLINSISSKLNVKPELTVIQYNNQLGVSLKLFLLPPGPHMNLKEQL
jgi:membrane-associated phospholipid phosphatase